MIIDNKNGVLKTNLWQLLRSGASWPIWDLRCRQQGIPVRMAL